MSQRVSQALARAQLRGHLAGGHEARRRVVAVDAPRRRHRRGPKLKDPIPNLTPIFQPNRQTLEASFSSASKPIFAPQNAFCSSFRELQDLQSFAPLQFQYLN